MQVFALPHLQPTGFRPLCLLLLTLCWLPMPTFGVAIEVQRVTLPGTFGTGMQPIDFASDVFVEAGVTPLVFVIPTTRGGNPCTLRFSDIRQTGFAAGCVEPAGRRRPSPGYEPDLYRHRTGRSLSSGDSGRFGDHRDPRRRLGVHQRGAAWLQQRRGVRHRRGHLRFFRHHLRLGRRPSCCRSNPSPARVEIPPAGFPCRF